MSDHDNRVHIDDYGQREVIAQWIEAHIDTDEPYRLADDLIHKIAFGAHVEWAPAGAPAEVIAERDQLQTLVDEAHDRYGAALFEAAELIAERDRLRAAFDRIALDPAEYRHALAHVADCDHNCEQCRDLARQALDCGVDAQERAADVLAERDQLRAAYAAATNAADAAAKAVGAMAGETSTTLAENTRLQAVVEAARRYRDLVTPGHSVEFSPTNIMADPTGAAVAFRDAVGALDAALDALDAAEVATDG